MPVFYTAFQGLRCHTLSHINHYLCNRIWVTLGLPEGQMNKKHQTKAMEELCSPRLNLLTKSYCLNIHLFT